MSIVTYRGVIPIGEQEKLHLSTNDGLTGYKIKKFQVLNQSPGTIDSQTVAKIFLTDQSGSINATINMNDPSLIAVCYQKTGNSGGDPANNIIIFDKETINQDIYVTVADAVGNTTPINFYVELEKFNINLNESTFSTLKNIRQSKADNL
tara:strand:- start:109 stop:558 length:450 start_codon:yes stop_codon:yes gene_type:complete